jgi:hypothetical protein
MGRIKIDDLPRESKISKQEMRAITGAGLLSNSYELLGGFNRQDVSEACFIRMMEATDDMTDDLEDDTRNILASFKSIRK